MMAENTVHQRGSNGAVGARLGPQDKQLQVYQSQLLLCTKEPLGIAMAQTNNALKWQALAKWLWDFPEVWDSIIKHYPGCNPHSKQQKLWTERVRQDIETASLLQKYVWPTKEPQTYRQLSLTYMQTVNTGIMMNNLPEVIRIMLALHLI